MDGEQLALVPTLWISTAPDCPKAQAQLSCFYLKNHLTTSQIFIFNSFLACDMLEVNHLQKNNCLMQDKIFWEAERKDKQTNQPDDAISFSPSWSSLYSWPSIWKQDCSQQAEMGPPIKMSGVRRTLEHPIAAPVNLKSTQFLASKKMHY